VDVFDVLFERLCQEDQTLEQVGGGSFAQVYRPVRKGLAEHWQDRNLLGMLKGVYRQATQAPDPEYFVARVEKNPDARNDPFKNNLQAMGRAYMARGFLPPIAYDLLDGDGRLIEPADYRVLSDTSKITLIMYFPELQMVGTLRGQDFINETQKTLHEHGMFDYDNRVFDIGRSSNNRLWRLDWGGLLPSFHGGEHSSGKLITQFQFQNDTYYSVPAHFDFAEAVEEGIFTKIQADAIQRAIQRGEGVMLQADAFSRLPVGDQEAFVVIDLPHFNVTPDELRQKKQALEEDFPVYRLPDMEQRKAYLSASPEEREEMLERAALERQVNAVGQEDHRVSASGREY